MHPELCSDDNVESLKKRNSINTMLVRAQSNLKKATQGNDFGTKKQKQWEETRRKDWIHWVLFWLCRCPYTALHICWWSKIFPNYVRWWRRMKLIALTILVAACLGSKAACQYPKSCDWCHPGTVIMKNTLMPTYTCPFVSCKLYQSSDTQLPK